MMRDNYIFKDNKIYLEGRKKPLKFKKLEGCHNNYQVVLPSKIKAFLKQSEGVSDYADIVSKRICDVLSIKCADCELITMESFPQENQKEIMSFEEYTEFCKQTFKIEDEHKLKEYYQDYVKKQEGEKVKTAVLSYDYQCAEPYASAQIIKLDDLVQKYCEITNTEGTFAIETYDKIAKELCDENSETGKKLRKSLKIKKHAKISSSIDVDLKKIALLGYVTCQMDMSSHNLHLALVKNKKEYTLEVAPLFDNGESFNLSSLNIDEETTTYDADITNLSSANYGNALSLYEKDGIDAKEQLASLAKEITSNESIARVYDALCYLNIDEICEKENIGEESFYIIKHAIVSIFKDRMALLSEEIKKLQQHEEIVEDISVSKIEEIKDLLEVEESISNEDVLGI